MVRQPIQVVATGIVVAEASDGATVPGTKALVTLTAFVEFDGYGERKRWTGGPQGPMPLPSDGSTTTALLHLVRDFEEDLLPDLGIAGLRTSRFDFYAAPRRIEVAPSLRERLTLD